jgi:hypothetical protein
MKQLTKKQAIEFHESEKWKELDVKERAAFQMYQDRLCMPFSEFHKAITEVLGRPVYTHEFGLNRDGLIAEMEGKAEPPSFADIVNMLPADKTVILST